MTSQSRDKATERLVYIEPKMETIQSSLRSNVQYHVDGTDTDAQRIAKLESDVEFLRSIITTLYDKCTKMTVSKKKKKNETVECENCGGLLW